MFESPHENKSQLRNVCKKIETVTTDIKYAYTF